MANKQNHPPFRVGIVGAGGIARTHAEVLKHRLDEADLVAICDISLESLSRFGDTFEVPGRYLDLGDMVDITGTSGSIRLDKPWDNSDVATALEYQTSGSTTTINFKPLLQYTNQLEHLCECLATGRPFRISPQHSIDQMKALDAIAESMATGCVVDLG